MNGHKYVALDVDSANIVAGVHDCKGEQVMQAHIRTNSSDIRQFFKAVNGTVHVTFEEGTQAAWLYDVIRPLVAEVIVCNPRHNKLLQAGNKADKIDVAKLAKLLLLGELQPVYHGDQTMEGLKHLARAYQNLVADKTRVTNRLKAIFRGRAVGCRGSVVFNEEQQEEWLGKLDIEGLQTRGGYLYEELKCLVKLKEKARKAMCLEASRHPAFKLTSSRVPGLGPIRTAQIIAIVGSPHRFRTKRQFWSYCGLAVVTRSSADYEWVEGRTRRRKKAVQTRGLNKNFNRPLKAIFKGAAVSAIQKDEFKQYHQRMIDKKIRPEMALLTTARKIAAITLAVWKKGETFDPKRLNQAGQSTDNQ